MYVAADLNTSLEMVYLRDGRGVEFTPTVGPWVQFPSTFNAIITEALAEADLV